MWTERAGRARHQMPVPPRAVRKERYRIRIVQRVSLDPSEKEGDH